jgi:hypothetical protein
MTEQQLAVIRFAYLNLMGAKEAADLSDLDELFRRDEYEANLFGSYYGIRLARTTESVWLVLRNQANLYCGIRLADLINFGE